MNFYRKIKQMNSEFIGESYMAKQALQASSQMGNPYPEFPALSPPTNDSKRLLAAALLNSSRFHNRHGLKCRILLADLMNRMTTLTQSTSIRRVCERRKNISRNFCWTIKLCNGGKNIRFLKNSTSQVRV